MIVEQHHPQTAPHIVTAILSLIVLMTPFIAFEDDQLPLGLFLFSAGMALIVWSMRRYPVPKRTGTLLLLLALISVITLVVSRQRYITGVNIAWLWSGALFLLLCISWTVGRLRTHYLTFLLLVSGLLLAVPGIWTFVRNGERASGLVSNANGLSGALFWSFFAALVFVLAKYRRRWTVPALLLVGGTLFLTISLTAFVAMIIPVVLAFWMFRRLVNWRRMMWVVVATVSAVVLVWFAWRPPQLVRLMTNQHVLFSFSQRWEFNRAALRMWQAKPFTGWGLGTYKQTFPRFTKQFNEQPLYAHNLFFQVLAETGLVGALAWLGLVIGIGRLGWLAVSAKDDGPDRWLMSGLYLGWLAFTIHAALDFSWYFPAGQIWWLLSSAVFITQTPGLHVTTARRPGHVIGAVVGAIVFLTAAATVLMTIPPTDRGLRAKSRSEDQLAIEQLTQAVRWVKNPQTVESLANVYWLRRKNEDLRIGERLIRSSLAVNPDDYSLYSALGHNLSAQHREVESLTAFRQAYVLDPLFHLDLSYSYITALKKNDRRDEAIQLLRQVIARYEHSATPNPIILRQYPMFEMLQKELLPDGL